MIVTAITNTRRATTGHLAGAVRLPSSSRLTVPSPRSEHLNASAGFPTCQGDITTRRNAKRVICPRRQGKMTFERILEAARPESIARLEDRAVIANQLAKITRQPARSACFRIKDEAVSALLTHDAAFVCELNVSAHDVEISVVLAGGGKLNVNPRALDLKARNVLEQQLIVLVRGGGIATIQGSRHALTAKTSLSGGM